jgi:hypothetical protein
MYLHGLFDLVSESHALATSSGMRAGRWSGEEEEEHVLLRCTDI